MKAMGAEENVDVQHADAIQRDQLYFKKNKYYNIIIISHIKAYFYIILVMLVYIADEWGEEIWIVSNISLK